MALAARFGGPAPLRPLAVLVVVVFLAHLLLLQATPGAIQVDDPMARRAFVTRTIEINKPAPEAAPAAAAPRVATPQPRPAPAPAPPAPMPEAPVARAIEPVPAPTPSAPTASPSAEPNQPAAPPVRREDGPRATAFSIPGSIRLNYNVTGEVKKQAWNARGELVWRHDGIQYDARLDVSAFLAGSRSRTSTGRITSEGLAPTRFSDKSRTEVAAHFERDRGRVVFSANTPEAPLLAGAQDQLSVILQIGAMIAGEPAKYPPATTITVQTIGPREADSWLFTVEGEERLNLVSGEVATLKLTRNPRREFDTQRVELWLAPAMGYLPARIRLTQQNGDYVDQQLRSTDRP